ncbi:MAG: hypothetical protein J6B96_01110 [Agathobacter sp.]|nr:hypothetical protein [Agathobacter sp.]
MIYFVTFVLIYGLRVLLKLSIWTCLAIGVFAFWMIPKYRTRYRKMKEYQQRFFDVSMYLDTILYSFMKEEKVELAVRDVHQALPEGKMKMVVGMAHDYMIMAYEEVEFLGESLAMIDQEYPCKRMRDVHKFMTHVEYYGGEIEKPIRLLLADKSRWEKRIKEEIASRNKQFVDVLLSVVASLVICSAILYLPIMDMDISAEPLLQVLAFVLIVLDAGILYRAQGYVTVDWIGLQLQENENIYEKKLQEYQDYDEQKQRKLSYILATIGVSVTGIAFCVGNPWMTMMCLLVTLLFVNQHKVGKYLLEKNLRRELMYAFPNWLLDLVLLLQSENVQMALQKSKEFVPGVLRKELYQLTDQLELEPESAKPYHEFLKDFYIPEVHSAMGILYSIAIGNSGNADKQISELVDKNLELLDMTERQMLKRQAGGMQVLFLLPVLVASFKLIADMMVLMLQFMQSSFM